MAMVVNLSDIHVRQYTLNKDLLQLQSVLVDKLRLGIFIADNYDPNVYSEKGFRFHSIITDLIYYSNMARMMYEVFSKVELTLSLPFQTEKR
jgi:hypothetical protein